jgi:farnesyl diphosphate synthase
MGRFAVLGWCIEWMQAWLLIADDMMDSSLTRRGQPCWYKLEHVNHIALNDAFCCEMLVFKMLKRHFGDEAYYMQLVDLLLETTWQTEVGQMLDTLCENVKLADFTVDRWTQIVQYKTSYYSFYCPVALGMIVAGIEDQSAYDNAREILVTMGIYFQAQDDFLDCFATPEVLGKIGTDIQDKKCGWLFVHAYNNLADESQKALLEATYGRCQVDSEEELSIKAMYKDLKLEDLYKQYESDSYDQIIAMKPKIQSQNILPWSIFEKFLEKVYKRAK